MTKDTALKRLILLIGLLAVDGLAQPSTANATTTADKLVSCTYTLRPKESLSEAVSRLVSGTKNFPLRTWGDSGWMTVTARLNSEQQALSTAKVLPANTQFSILMPELQLKIHSDELKDCGDEFYLVKTTQEPTSENVAQLTANLEIAGPLKESDLAADFVELQPLMPAVQRDGSWYFLMRFVRMVKEVSPIVQTQ